VGFQQDLEPGFVRLLDSSAQGLLQIDQSPVQLPRRLSWIVVQASCPRASIRRSGLATRAIAAAAATVGRPTRRAPLIAIHCRVSSRRLPTLRTAALADAPRRVSRH
jgi:hypothetical protein